jgi:hypothetical protein
MPFSVIASAQKRRILYWAAASAEANASLANCPDIGKSDMLKIARIARIYIETGNFPQNSEKFKKVEGQKDLFSIKAHQIRLLGSFLDQFTFGVAWCIRKKRNKHRKQDLEKALANIALMKREWENE